MGGISITEVRNLASTQIMEAGMSPVDVKILSYDASKDLWHIFGSFQNGYLGDTFHFEADFNPNNRSFVRFKIGA